MSKYTIALDTLCEGYTCAIFEDDKPVTFETIAEAQAEMDSDPEFYDAEECFIIPIEELGHKTIYTGSK